jgi:hypothetical protein
MVFHASRGSRAPPWRFARSVFTALETARYAASKRAWSCVRVSGIFPQRAQGQWRCGAGCARLLLPRTNPDTNHCGARSLSWRTSCSRSQLTRRAGVFGSLLVVFAAIPRPVAAANCERLNQMLAFPNLHARAELSQCLTDELDPRSPVQDKRIRGVSKAILHHAASLSPCP